MITGNGPPRSGWVMKVVVLPSLVAISICWSIMGVSLCFVILVGWHLARLQGKPTMTRQAPLEPGAPRRHCLVARTLVQRAERVTDDPDQQSLLRRDRPPDERCRRCRPG